VDNIVIQALYLPLLHVKISTEITPYEISKAVYFFRITQRFDFPYLKVKVFWVVTPCNVVVGYHRFRGPCYPENGDNMDPWSIGILPQH